MGELEFACVIYCILKSIIVTTVPHLSFKTTSQALTMNERRLNGRLTDAGMTNPQFINCPFKGHVMNQIPQSRTRVAES